MTELPRLRILLVEDEPLIAILMEDLLEEMGHTVCATETTEASAVEAARSQRPDLMIVDFRLSEGSGMGAVNAILESGFIPHIFTSGDELARRELNASAIFLRKPFLDIDLVEAIQKAVAIRRLN